MKTLIVNADDFGLSEAARAWMTRYPGRIWQHQPTSEHIYKLTPGTNRYYRLTLPLSFYSGMVASVAVGAFAVLGIILASILFGFSLGALFCGFVVLLMGGYILYQTSLVMAHFPPTASVAAALMLFSTIATLFWYVLQLLMSLNNRR